ncbi:MAG: hypothetical protein KJZ93_09715 [Caldilineaceae bacterium]|nr:hypothetical protein [Caldilineaceae bacterium]
MIIASQERVLTGLLAPLRCVGGIEVVGIRPTISEASQIDPTVRPQLALVDLGDPVSPNYEELAALHNQAPTLPIVVLAAQYQRGVLDQIYRTGVRAFLTQDVGLPLLVETLHTVHHGGVGFIVKMGRG